MKYVCNLKGCPNIRDTLGVPFCRVHMSALTPEMHEKLKKAAKASLQDEINAIKAIAKQLEL